MKKVFLRSLLISVIFNAIGFLINLISFYTSNRLPLSIAEYGGEITSYEGFGLRLTHYYPMSDGTHPVHVEPSLKFGPVSLLLTLIAVFIVCFIILTIIRKVKANKK